MTRRCRLAWAKQLAQLRGLPQLRRLAHEQWRLTQLLGHVPRAGGIRAFVRIGLVGGDLRMRLLLTHSKLVELSD